MNKQCIWSWKKFLKLNGKGWDFNIFLFVKRGDTCVLFYFIWMVRKLLIQLTRILQVWYLLLYATHFNKVELEFCTHFHEVELESQRMNKWCTFLPRTHHWYSTPTLTNQPIPLKPTRTPQRNRDGAAMCVYVPMIVLLFKAGFENFWCMYY